MQEDMVFVPFAYVEAAANILTNPQLDPVGKIPEFKYCAAKVEPVRVAEAAGVTLGARLTADWCVGAIESVQIVRQRRQNQFVWAPHEPFLRHTLRFVQ